jgi:hypothetical protein
MTDAIRAAVLDALRVVATAIEPTPGTRRFFRVEARGAIYQFAVLTLRREHEARAEAADRAPRESKPSAPA